MEPAYTLLNAVPSRWTQIINNPRNIILVFAALGFASITCISMIIVSPSPSSPRFASTMAAQTLDYISVNGATKSNVPFNGILNSEWCKAPVEPPLPYLSCKRNILMRMGLYSSLSNALGFILKGGMWAFQEEWCFYIEEGYEATQGAARVSYRAPPEKRIIPFLERYFEPIGIPKSSVLVQNKDQNFNEVIEPHYKDIAIQMSIKPYNHHGVFFRTDIPSLGLHGKNVVWLKKYMLRRMIRLLKESRDTACSKLNNHGLHEEYIAMFVKTHNKAKDEPIVQQYIDKAEVAILNHFEGIAPKLYVVLDDCNVMDEFRKAKPDWTFVSECDNASGTLASIIEDKNLFGTIEKWTLDETDTYYHNLFSALIGMSSAKYFIGDPTAGVATIVYFMRSYYAGDDTWALVGYNNWEFY